MASASSGRRVAASLAPGQPVIEIGHSPGSSLVLNSTTSVTRRSDGPGGNRQARRARNSARMSLCRVPVSAR